MSDKIEHLMLEQFRRLNDKVDGMTDEIRELKTVMLGMKHELRAIQLNTDMLGESIDGVRKRVDRIERRLELSDAPSQPTGLSDDTPPYEPRPTKRGG